MHQQDQWADMVERVAAEFGLVAWNYGHRVLKARDNWLDIHDFPPEADVRNRIRAWLDA